MLILNRCFSNLFPKGLQRQRPYLVSYQYTPYFPYLSNDRLFASFEVSYQSGWRNNVFTIYRWVDPKVRRVENTLKQVIRIQNRWWNGLGKHGMKYWKEKIYCHNELYTVALFNTSQPSYFCHVCFLPCSWEYYASVPLLLGICKTCSRYLWKAGTYAQNYRRSCWVHRVWGAPKMWELCCRFQGAEHLIISESKNTSTLNKHPLNLSTLFTVRAICFECVKRKLSLKTTQNLMCSYMELWS